MANESVVFSRGLSTTMPSTITPGMFLVQTDTGAMFLDDTASSRIQILDTTKLPLSGGTLTGNLLMSDNRIYFGDSATNTVPNIYADDENYLYLNAGSEEFTISSNGGTMIQVGNQSVSFNTSGISINGAAGNNHINNLDNPTTDRQAANKAYVDTAFTELENEYTTALSGYLPLKGGTMTGDIDVSGTNKIVFGDSNIGTTTVGYTQLESESGITGSDYRIMNYLPNVVATGTVGASITFNSLYQDASNITSTITINCHDGGSGPSSSITLDGADISLVGNHVTLSSTPTDNSDITNKQYVDQAIAAVAGSGSQNIPGGLLFATCAATSSSSATVINLASIESTETPVNGAYVQVLCTNGLSTSNTVTFNSNSTSYTIVNNNSDNLGVMTYSTNSYQLYLFLVSGTELQFMGCLNALNDGIVS